MEKVIIFKELSSLANNSEFTAGEIIYSLLLKLGVNSRSEILTKSNKDILQAVSYVSRTSVIADAPMTDSEWDAWISSK